MVVCLDIELLLNMGASAGSRGGGAGMCTASATTRMWVRDRRDTVTVITRYTAKGIHRRDQPWVSSLRPTPTPSPVCSYSLKLGHLRRPRAANWSMAVIKRLPAAAMLAVLASSCTSPTRSNAGAAPLPTRPIGATSLPYTAADAHFMTGMIHHHAQAIVMASWAPAHGASPELQRLAQRIAVAQNDEIALMRTWLRDKGEPVPDANPGPMRMMMNGVEHEILMPGMLSDAQLQQLDDARGVDFDRLFLTLMIQHHEGAVTMVDALFPCRRIGLCRS